MTDLISRADAIECCQCHGSLDCINRIKALPSADAEPTVIRSRTLLPTKDFKEWAKRIREVNPNVVVIPCDAEVVSADAVQGEWIPCSDKLPSNNDCVLVTVDDSIEFGKYQDGEWSIWVCDHWDKWDAKGTIAWMPLPKPYKGGDE